MSTATLSQPKVTVVSSALFGLTRRMDPAFHVLVVEHREAYDEFLRTFTLPDLIEFADALPYDQETALVVWTGRAGATPGHEAFRKWLHTRVNSQPDRAKSDVALYCAVGLRTTKARIADDLARLEAEKQAKLEALDAIKDKVFACKSGYLIRSFTGSTYGI